MKIWFYFRDAEVGDYVYHDGSYSPVPIRNRHLIGICIFVNSHNPKERLLLGTEDLSNGAPWGLSTFNITLEDDPGYSVLDTPLPNISSAGVTLAINESTMLDPLSPDGFKVYPITSPYGNYGFVSLIDDISYGEQQYKAGQSIPRGLYNTLILLNHRDKILKDSDINLGVPRATQTETEMQSLNRLLDEIVMKNSGQTDYQQYYYPPVSFCHAYEPTVEEDMQLAEKFKSGNWFLPGLGDLARACWLYIDKKFEDAIISGDFKPFFATGAPRYYHASTEEDSWRAWNCSFVLNGVNSNQDKRSALSVRPVCAF